MLKVENYFDEEIVICGDEYAVAKSFYFIALGMKEKDRFPMKVTITDNKGYYYEALMTEELDDKGTLQFTLYVVDEDGPIYYGKSGEKITEEQYETNEYGYEKEQK
ncbi:MAG: hypothetical protein AABY32_01670 [Nanoarchaeota archaeon]